MTTFRKLKRYEIEAIRAKVGTETPHAMAKRYGVSASAIWKQTKGLCRARVQYEGGCRKLSPAELDAVVAFAASPCVFR
jgi:hypothetical protein